MLCSIVICGVSCNEECYDSDRYSDILVIHTYSPEYCNWEKEVNAGILDGFKRKRLKGHIHSLYLNFISGTEEQARDTIFRTLQVLQNLPLDLILVSDDEAVLALMECRHPLVDKLPVVFCGVDFIDRGILEKRRNFTGFMTTPDYNATHHLARQLFGNVDLRAVLVDTSRVGLMAADKDYQLVKGCSGLMYMYPFRYSRDEKGELSWRPAVNKFPKPQPGGFNSFHLVIQDRELNSYIPYSFAYQPKIYFVMPHWCGYYSLLLQLVNLNYLNVGNEGFGENILGEYFCSSYTQGFQAMERAACILKGKKPENLPIEMSPKNYYFDWHVMVNRNITPDQLPLGSRIVGMPFSLRYQLWFIAGGFVLGLLVLLFGGGLIRASFLAARRRKKLYRILKKEEQKLAATVGALNEAIIVFDSHWHIRKMNKVAQQILEAHTREKDFTGKLFSLFFEITVINNLNYQKELLREITMTNKPHTLDSLTYLLMVDGNTIPVSGSITPVMKADQYVGYMFSFRNITDKVVNQKFVELGIKSAGVYMWRFDEKERCMIFDKEFYSRMNMEIKDGCLPLAVFLSLIHPEDIRKWKELLVYTNHSQEKRLIEIRLRLSGSGEEYIWVEFRVGYRKKALDGNFKYMPYGLCSDITQQKQKEQQLREVLKKAEDADRQKTVFLHSMSHEIRTPLNAIVGFCGLLGEDSGFSREERRQFIDMINVNCEALMGTISDILEISRVENGVLFNEAPFSAIQLVRLVEEKVGHILPEQVSLQLILPEMEIFMVGDQNRLLQVLTHLMKNAVKFTPDKGNIILEVEEKEDGQIIFSVKDTGIGIAPEDLDKIFNRFYRVNDFIQGTGLGLPLCSEIIKRMNGRIQVESDLGKGTTFRVIVPKIFKRIKEMTG